MGGDGIAIIRFSSVAVEEELCRDGGFDVVVK